MSLIDKVVQKSMDCTINFAHRVTLPYETELAKFKRKELAPFLSMCQFEQKRVFPLKNYVRTKRSQF